MTDIVEDGAKYVNVAANAAFQSRITPKRAREMTPEQRFWANALQAATELHAAGVPVNLDNLHSRLRARYTRKSLVELMGTEKWAGALERRGIPFAAERDTLTPLQMSFLALYFDTATPASHRQKLAQAGVSAEQLRGWMRQPVFAAEMERLRQSVLRDGFTAATQALVAKAAGGDIQAIDRVMAFNGEDFRTLTGEDIAGLLGAIFDILEQNAVPVGVMQQIARAVRGTPAGVAATMNAITTIVTPEET